MLLSLNLGTTIAVDQCCSVECLARVASGHYRTLLPSLPSLKSFPHLMYLAIPIRSFHCDIDFTDFTVHSAFAGILARILALTLATFLSKFARSVTDWHKLMPV